MQKFKDFFFLFFGDMKKNIFEEEGVVCPPKVPGCKKKPGLNNNRSATAPRQEANLLKSQIANAPK